MKTKENIRSEYFRELEKLRANLNQSRSELISEKEKLNVLIEISIGLFNAKSFEDIGKTIEQAVLKIIPNSDLGFKLGVYENEIYRIVYNISGDILSLSGEEHKLSELNFFSKIAIDTKKTLVIQDNHSPESLKIDPRQINRYSHSMIFIPLYSDNGFVGLLSFARAPANSMDDNLIAVLDTISKYVCLAVEKLLLEKQRSNKETKIIESELRYRKLLSSVTDYLYSVEFEYGKPVRTIYGESSKIVTGYSKEELESSEFLWIDMVFPGDKELVLEKVKLLSAGVSIPPFQHRIISKDGQIKWISNTTVVHHSENGELIGYEGMVRDITVKKDLYEKIFNFPTENKKNNRPEQLFELLSSSDPYLIAYIDVSGKPIYFSNSWLTVLGFPHDVLDKSTIFGLIHPDDRLGFESLFVNELLPKRININTEFRIVNINNSVCYFKSVLKPVEDDNGDVEYVVMFAHDVTHEKLSEENNVQTLDRYKVAFEVSEDGFYDWNLVTNDIYCSPQYFNMLGYKEDKLHFNPQTILKLIHSDDRDRFESFLNYYLSSGTSAFEIDFRLKCNDGSYKWILSRGKPIEYGDNGKPVRLVGFNTDITIRKSSEEFLKISEEKYRTLFDTMKQGVVYQDADGKIISVNKAAEEILGLSFEQLRGLESIDKSWRTIHDDGTCFPGEEHPAMVSLRTGEPVSDIIMGIFNPAIDKFKWAIVSSVPLFRKGESRPYQVYATITDITELREAQTAVNKSEAKFSILFDSMNEGVALHEVVYENGKPVNYRLLNVNPMFEKIIGVTKEMVMNKLANEVYLTEEPPYLDIFSSVAETGNSYHYETYFEKMDKHFYISVISYEKGKFATVFFDITEMKQIENELRLSEEKFRLVVNQLPLLIWTVDKDLKFTFFEGKTAQTIYKDQNWYIGTSLLDFFEKNGIKDELPNYQQALQGNKLRYEITLGKRVSDVLLQPLYDLKGGIIGVIGMAFDITERKKAEEVIQRQLAELEKKNAELERFTYTVSHDLKSPLITIKGFLGMLISDAQSGNWERMQSDIKRISNAADKMQNLLEDLLELSRIGRIVNPPSKFYMNEVVKEVIELLEQSIKNKNVKLIIQPNMPMLIADRLRIREVVQNLLENSIKYAEAGKEPEIEFGFDSERKCFFISDNGIGIDDAYHNKIFGLFEKLNASTEGTGIGLALVKRIIELHEGRVWVESELGKGATFYFTISENNISPGGK